MGKSLRKQFAPGVHPCKSLGSPSAQGLESHQGTRIVAEILNENIPDNGAKRLGLFPGPSELAPCTQLAAGSGERSPFAVRAPCPLAVQQLGNERQSTSPFTRSFLFPKSKQMSLDIFHQSLASILQYMEKEIVAQTFTYFFMRLHPSFCISWN